MRDRLGDVVALGGARPRSPTPRRSTLVPDAGYLGLTCGLVSESTLDVAGSFLDSLTSGTFSGPADLPDERPAPPDAAARRERALRDALRRAERRAAPDAAAAARARRLGAALAARRAPACVACAGGVLKDGAATPPRICLVVPRGSSALSWVHGDCAVCAACGATDLALPGGPPGTSSRELRADAAGRLLCAACARPPSSARRRSSSLLRATASMDDAPPLRFSSTLAPLVDRSGDDTPRIDSDTDSDSDQDAIFHSPRSHRTR